MELSKDGLAAAKANKPRRGSWTLAQKRQAVAESHAMGANVAEVAAAEGVIEIDLTDGCVRIRGIVDARMLREVLAAVR